MNLQHLKRVSTLPKITHSKGISKFYENIQAILPEKDVKPDHKDFGSYFISSRLREDLTKKKSVFAYGGEGNNIASVNFHLKDFKTNKDILTNSAELTRHVKKEKNGSPVVYYSGSITNEQIGTHLYGMCQTNYKFSKKTYIDVTEDKKPKSIDSIEVISENLDLNSESTKFNLKVAENALFAREITNLRVNEANPETMLQLCKDLANSLLPNVKIEYIVGKELVERGMNLVYNVGRGASTKPCMVILKYEGNPKDPNNVYSMIGKGVCYDSGGLNLKSADGLQTMFNDKGGSAATLSTFKGIAEMNLPINVVLGVSFVENKLGSDAYRTSDIIQSLKGLTVEISNTDAEGRLILADTMTYVQQKHKPHTMIELSTLTGACIVALGFDTAGLFTNNDDLAAELLKISQNTNEGLWQLPITEEFRNYNNVYAADLTNAANVKYGGGGAGRAAAFLEKFVEKDVKWAHIDIAGTAFKDSEKFIYSQGGTGYGVNLLLNYFKQKSTN